MLIKLSVSNFLSFREKIILDFEAGTIKEKDQNLSNIAFSNWKNRLLKSIALYGANSSGKSNVIKAFAFVRSLVLNSAKESQVYDKINVENFKLNYENINLPSLFELEFRIRNEIFKYGFEVTSERVESEWLFQIIKGKNEIIFVRNKSLYEFNKKLIWITADARAKLSIYTNMTRENTLFLSSLANLNDDLGKKIINWFSATTILFDGNNAEVINYTASLLQDRTYNAEINKLIGQADLGFSNVRASAQENLQKQETFRQFISSAAIDTKKSYTIYTSHKKYDNQKHTDNIDFNLLLQESLGSQKFFGLLGPIIKSLQSGSILWVDELDSKFHPHLFSAIIKLFNSNMNNPNNAQLVFTANNTIPLKDLLRRDQMVFVEKDKLGASNIGSLYYRYPHIRNDASFEKDYLSGKYGSVPKMGSQLDLFGEE